MKCGSGFQIAVEKLKREHNLSRFDCGNPVLTSWLQKFAWTNQQADSARTYVALRENLVIGYYALAAGSVQKRESPKESQEVSRGIQSALCSWRGLQLTAHTREKGWGRRCCLTL